MVANNTNGQHASGPEFRSTVITITPEIAKEWLETMQYEYQRKVRWEHVFMLSKEMEGNRFVPGTTIRIAIDGARKRLIDGQHRLNAVLHCGIAQTFVVLEERVSEGDEEYVAWVYGSTDIGKRRPPADLYSALKLSDKFGLTKTQINVFAPAVDFLAAGMLPKGVRVDRHERLHQMAIYAPYMRQFVEITTDCEKTIGAAIRRSYVVAVALLSLRFSLPHARLQGRPDVVDFWRGVALDDKIATNDPRKVANRHLLTSTMTNSHNTIGSRTVVTAPYGARYLANCFNAYIARQDRKMGKVPDATSSFQMYGVPRSVEDWIK